MLHRLKKAEKWSTDNVVDHKAYKRYEVLKKQTILNDGKYVDLSDGGTLELSWLPHILNERIKDLPADEKEAILAKKAEYATALG